MKKSWKTISSKVIYKNAWVKVREDKVIRPDGKPGIYSVLDKKPSVIIIAQDIDKSIYFIKQFRYPMSKYLIELPAGVANTKNLISDAKRELKEEIGITAKSWKILGKFYPACSDASFPMYAVLAKELNTSNVNVYGEGNELISNVTRFKLSEIKKLIAQGKIECGPSLAALSMLYLKHKYANIK